MNWLALHFRRCSLREDHAGYLLGRGAKDESLIRFGVKTWKPMATDSPDTDFHDRYGPKGERLTGWVLWPLYSPRGRIIGFAGRMGTEKRITRYLLPEAAWQPLWTGLMPSVMEKVWQGANIWVVEGIFDLFSLEWAIPDTDVVLGSERANLTNKHVEFLRRYCRGWVHMVYDNDEAGRHGTQGWVDERGKKRWGALQRLDRVGVRATSISYRGKDPGDVWSKQGVTGVRAAFMP